MLFAICRIASAKTIKRRGQNAEKGHVTSHQPPMTRDCGDGSVIVRSRGGWPGWRIVWIASRSSGQESSVFQFVR